MTSSIEVKGVKVIINAREEFFSENELDPNYELSYEQVVARAKEYLPSYEQVEYTVTYFNGAGRPQDGELKPGEKVKVADGTGFDVDATDLS